MNQPNQGTNRIETLGRGAFATVFRARDPGSGREFAVKEPLHGSAAAAALIEAEESALKQIPSGIGPAVYGREGPALTLELVNGRPLAGLGPASPDVAADAAVALASTLKRLHEAGFVHGDLTPAHVVMENGGTCRLLDFGLSHRIGSSPAAAGGSGAGTPAYVSPEAAAGRFGDPRSDLYSAGAVLYELLSGSPPFSGIGGQDTLRARAAAAPQPPSRLAPRVPAALDSLCLRLLQPDPDARFQDAATFAAAATAAAESREVGRFRSEDPAGSLLTPAFQSRETELREIMGAALSNPQRNRLVFVISGSHGIGKTRFLAELRAALMTQGAAVLDLDWGRKDFGIPGADSGQALTALLADDIDSQPAARLSAAGRLIDSMPLRPAVVVCAAGRGFSRDGLPASMGGQGSKTVEKPLPPLDPQRLKRLARSMIGFADLGALFEEEVARASRGSPGLAAAIVRDLAETGVLTRSKAGWQLLRPLPMPLVSGRNAASCLVETARSLPPELLSVLAAASVLEVPSPAETVAQVSALSRREFDAALSRLASEGLMRTDPAPAPVGPEFARLFVSKIEPDLVRAYHERAAAALKQARVYQDVARRGRHLVRAGHAVEAAEAFVDASRKALSMGRTAEARSLAMEAAQVPGLPKDAAARAKAAAEDASAREQRASGSVEAAARGPAALIEAGRYAEARAMIDASLKGADADRRSRDLLLMAQAYIGEGRLPSAEEALGTALVEAQAAGRPDRMHFAYVALARMNLDRRELRNAARNLDRVAETVGSAGLESAAEALLLRAEILLESGEGGAALGTILRAREISVRGSLGRAIAACDALEAMATAAMGEPARAKAAAGRMLSSSRKQGSGARARARAAAGNILRLAGEYNRAARHLKAAATGFRKTRNGLGEVGSMLLAGYCHALDRDGESALEAVTAASAVFGSLPTGGLRRLSHSVRSLALTIKGDREGAATAAKEAEKSGGRPEDDPFGFAVMEAARSSAAFASSDPGSGRAAGERCSSLLSKEAHAAERAHILSLLSEMSGPSSTSDPAALRFSESLAKDAEAFFTAASLNPVAAKARFRGRAAREAALEQPRESKRAGARAESACAEPGAGEKASAPTASPADREALSALARVSKTINSELDLSKLVPLIMDMAVETVEAERGFLLLEKGAELVAEVARSFDREEIGKPAFEVSRSIAEHVVRSGEPVVTDDAGADERFGDRVSVMGLRLRSVLCVPFRLKGRTLGAVYVEDRRCAGAFDADDLEFLCAFADQAAVALENARLYEDLAEKARMLEESKREVEALNRELAAKVDRQATELTEMSRRMEAERVRARLRYDYGNIVGRSGGMQEVFRLLDKVTDSDAPVLIVGASGTGKELVARAIHFNGPRKDKTFAAENCAALAEQLLESELFGHVRGAFTGAVSDRKGLFEIADGGTMFLDEVGEMSPGMQAKLLRVLQEGEFRPVGGKSTKKVDVRLVTASNRDLGKMVEEGRFREDLYYRINVIKVVLPPLCERMEDIPDLAKRFLDAESQKTGKGLLEVSQEAMRALLAYSWPGNVRELENVIRRAVALCDDVILPGHLPPAVSETGAGRGGQDPASQGSMKEIVEALESRMIRAALARHADNRTRAAEELGLSRFGLLKKMTRYGIQ